MKKSTLLLALFLSFSATAKEEMTLYFIPSPLGIDWSTPSNLAWSALKNRLSLQSRFMGHVFVELECGENKELTGMVGKNFDYLNQLLIHGRGLGILYHSFDGTLEEAPKVDAEIKELLNEPGRMNFVRYRLNKSQCLRAQTYLKEYREKDVGRYYGLANRPLYGEGAGCSAFGASFLSVIGIMDQEIQDNWSQSVNIPLEYSGPPIQPEKVHLLKLMFMSKEWAKEDQPHKKLSFWSPDRMYDWVKNKIAKPNPEKFTILESGKSQGIEIDKSYLPVALGPIWQQHLDESIVKKKK